MKEPYVNLLAYLSVDSGAFSNRSSRLIHIASYSAVIHLVGFLFSYHLYRWLWPQSIISAASHSALHSIVALLIVVPGSIMVGSTLSPLNQSFLLKPPTRKWNKLYLCLVTRGTNPGTVDRVVNEMRRVQDLDNRIELVVVTEEGANVVAKELGVAVMHVPAAFSASVAKHKARALEYFRVTRRLAPNDWVLHLDEETTVDEHCVLACKDFIERNTEFEWGQGIIAYNTTNYWYNSVLTFAEITRFRDDLGRFQAMHGRIHRPIFGCHGSFLLTSGKVENAVTWETDCLAEDFWFANRAWFKAGFGGGFIPSVAREQSNWTARDLLKQRRGWFCGMWEVGVPGQISVALWVLSLLGFPAAIMGMLGLLRIPLWLETWMVVYVSCDLFSLAFATVLQDLDASLSPWSIVFHLGLTPILSVLANGLQFAAVFYSFFSPPQGFHIVTKQ